MIFEARSLWAEQRMVRGVVTSPDKALAYQLPSLRERKGGKAERRGVSGRRYKGDRKWAISQHIPHFPRDPLPSMKALPATASGLDVKVLTPGCWLLITSMPECQACGPGLGTMMRKWHAEGSRPGRIGVLPCGPVGELLCHCYLQLHSERRKVKGSVPGTQSSDTTNLPRQPGFFLQLPDPRAALLSRARPVGCWKIQTRGA